MSTQLHNSISIDLPHVEGLKVGIVAARWNNQVTDPLLNGAIDRIVEAGYSHDDITIVRVPGTVELTYAAAQMARSKDFDAIIMIGCVIHCATRAPRQPRQPSRWQHWHASMEQPVTTTTL